MALSNKALDLVIVVDYQADTGVWTTPSRAARMCCGKTHLEIIDETHKERKFWERRLGPKPLIVIPAKEGFQDEE